MSRSYTPGLKVLSHAIVEKKRLLPLKGKVNIKKGDKVSPETIVASTEIPGNVQMINIANKLNIEPELVPESMLVKIDENISKNQIIAENNGIFGFFKTNIQSPIDGTLSNVSKITGQAILSELPIPINVDAYTSGIAIEIIPEEGVVIKTEASIIQGILGIGGENRGNIKVVVSGPDQPLVEDMITSNLKGKVIVGGSYLSRDVYQRCKQVGVSGIVTGGFNYHDLSQILGYSLGVAITGSEQIGPSLIITEGFGKVPMALRTFDLLQSNEDRFAAINGATQIRAGVIRPEILIPIENNTNSYKANNNTETIISSGSIVRVIRDPYFGLVGKVKSLPAELQKMESETMVRVAEIDFENGQNAVIPRANLEMILQ